MADPSSSTLTRYFAPSLEEENGGRVVAVDYHVNIESDVKRILAFQDAEIARLSARLALVTEALHHEQEKTTALLSRGPTTGDPQDARTASTAEGL